MSGILFLPASYTLQPPESSTGRHAAFRKHIFHAALGIGGATIIFFYLLHKTYIAVPLAVLFGALIILLSSMLSIKERSADSDQLSMSRKSTYLTIASLVVFIALYTLLWSSDWITHQYTQPPSEDTA